jgi:predicted outer membrane repeat protein
VLLLDLLSELLAGAVSSDEVRHVSDVGEDVYDGSAGRPFRTIAAALAVAPTLGGRRLVIRLHGSTPFTESLDLPSHVTITGPGTIRAATAGPAVRIAGTAAARRSGIVLADLELTGKAPFAGVGGALRIENADGVRLERCILRDSRAGRGAGAAVLTSTAVVLDACAIRGNRAGETATPVDIIPPTLAFPTGDGHGGGAYLEDSDVTLRACDVTGNQAVYAGGGIAVSNAARPGAAVEITGCETTRNQVSHQPLTALGVTWRTIAPAPADDMGDPVRAAFTGLTDAKELLLLANAHGMNYESGLGGGIALRNARGATAIRGCRIGVTRAGDPAPNIARRGGGIHLYVGAHPVVEDNVIANNGASGDGGGVGADFFDPFIPNGETRFGIAAVAMVPRDPVVLAQNEVRDNQAIEDGAGVYVTGGVRAEVVGGLFAGNRAGEHGGGIRATYASRLRATGVRFERNHANVITTEAEGDKEGGGAVSARNSDVHLERCAFVLNRAIDFAGGAIYYRSSFEGGVGATGLAADVHGMFDELQETAFGYGRRLLRIVDCEADDNRALGPRGAGGFLYALRSPDVIDNVLTDDQILGGQEPMWVSVEGEATDIRPCTSEHDRGGTVGRRKRGTIVVELSGTLAAPGVPADRFQVAREVKPAALAPSTPAPDARAIVVMPDADQTRDLRQPAFAGGPSVYGPAPALTALDTAFARAAGGTRVRATGTGFEAGMRVHVGGRAAVVAAETATTIDFDVPAGAPAREDVVVSLESGAQGWLTDALTLVPAPLVTFMSALAGRAGDTVTVRGSGLPVGTTVQFMFGAAAVDAAVAQDADDELTVTVPPAPAGQTTARLRATSPTGEQFTRPPDKAFQYRVP